MTINVKLLQHSISLAGISMYSFEAEIPRIAGAATANTSSGSGRGS